MERNREKEKAKEVHPLEGIIPVPGMQGICSTGVRRFAFLPLL